MKKQIITISVLLLTLVIPQVSGQEMRHFAQKFINKTPNKVFIGAIMDGQTLNEDTYKLQNISINPITITFSIPQVKAIELAAPSYDSMMNVVRNLVTSGTSIKQNDNFSIIVRELNSLNELSINWGAEISPTALFGNMIENSMAQETMFIDISQTFFTLSMEIPSSLTNDKERLDKIQEPIYVNSIQFGKKVTVLVENSANKELLKTAISKTLGNVSLTAEEEAVLAGSSIHILQIGTSNTLQDINPDNPFATILAYFRQAVSAEDFGVPISFTAAHVGDNSVFENSYSF